MFFSHLDQVLTQGVDLNITVSKSDTGMVVLLMPRINGLKDPAQNHIVPLRLSGQPQELDANFFPNITQPIRKVSGLLVSMEQFEKQVEKAEAERKEAKQKKDAEAKSIKAKKDANTKPGNDKKDKYESYLKKSEEYEAAGNLDSALLNLQQARLHAEEDQTKTVDERIAVIKGKMMQGSLFEVPAAQPQQAAASPASAQPIPQVQPMQPVPQMQVPLQQTQASVQQPMPPQQPSQIAQPVQQQGIQPNMQGFGMFGQQPAAAPQSTAPMQQTPQPVQPQQAAATISGPQDIVPAYNAKVEGPACRENEYAEYEDFPPEMAPPVYQQPQPQTAY